MLMQWFPMRAEDVLPGDRVKIFVPESRQWTMVCVVEQAARWGRRVHFKTNRRPVKANVGTLMLVGRRLADARGA